MDWFPDPMKPLSEKSAAELATEAWLIIPALSEPLVRNLRATTPESESH